MPRSLGRHTGCSPQVSWRVRPAGISFLGTPEFLNRSGKIWYITPPSSQEGVSKSFWYTVSCQRLVPPKVAEPARPRERRWAPRQVRASK